MTLSARAPFQDRPRLITAFTMTGAAGDWESPASHHLSLGMTLNPYHGRWKGRSGLVSAAIVPGDIGLCEYDRPRVYTFDRAVSVGVVVLDDDLVREVSQETRYFLPDFQWAPLVKDATLTSLSRLLLAESQEGFLNGALYSDSLGTALAQYLWNNYAAPTRTARDVVGGMAPSLLRRSLEFIRLNLDQDLRLEELAHVAEMSRSHFLRSFRKTMGITPHQFVLNERILLAQKLMRDRKLSLTNIALACGFSDQHHLSRMFRRQVGVTPSRYRSEL